MSASAKNVIAINNVIFLCKNGRKLTIDYYISSLFLVNNILIIHFYIDNVKFDNKLALFDEKGQQVHKLLNETHIKSTIMK